MDRLFTPWRYDYLVSEKAKGPCVFCTALGAGDDRANLILRRDPHHFVILNRYPYSSGHLMVVPNRHIGNLSAASAEERHELMDLAARCERALDTVYHPEGFNLGLNLGRSAGAGIADHIHLHLVPRWGGDTNFMTVLGETRLIPEELDRTWSRLKDALDSTEGD